MCDIPAPLLKPNQVLVKVRASSMRFTDIEPARESTKRMSLKTIILEQWAPRIKLENA